MTLDEKLTELSTKTGQSKALKEIYDKRYQATLKEVVDKQKEARNANKPVALPGKSGPTADGKILLEEQRRKEEALRKETEAKREQAREEMEQQEEDKNNSMDVDEPVDGKGKGRDK